MPQLTTFDRPSVEEFAREFEDIFYKGDAIAMAAYYTENARLMAEGIDPVQGRSSIEAFWRSTCEHAKSLGMKRKIVVDDIEISNEISYAVCTLLLHFQLPNGQSVSRTVKDITIWRQQADGTWKIEVDISNPNAPAGNIKP